MKQKFKLFGTMAAVLAMACQVFAGTVGSGAFVIPATLTSITNTTLSAAGTAVTIPPGCGIVIMPQTTAAQSTNTASILLGFDLTGDTTNWTTTNGTAANGIALSTGLPNGSVVMTNVCAGTNFVTGSLILTPAQLSPYRQIRFGDLGAASATAVSVSNIWYTFFQ